MYAEYMHLYGTFSQREFPAHIYCDGFGGSLAFQFNTLAESVITRLPVPVCLHIPFYRLDYIVGDDTLQNWSAHEAGQVKK